MRIAYFIIAHHKFPQFCWLFDAIYTAEDVFLIHVDKKSSDEFYSKIKSYVGTRFNISFLPRRAVTWGGWSVTSVELQAIKTLLDSDAKWQYYINVSGQDYPIKSIESMKANLQAQWPRNFVEVLSFARMQEIDADDPHLNRSLVFDVFGRLVRTPLRLPFPTSIDIKYKGSQWHMLTREFCAWVLADPMTKRIQKLVKYTWAPDELFFQALIMNSPYRDLRAEHYGRGIIWPGNTPSPKTFTMKDYDWLSASKALFARKFDESVDRQVLEHLASDHGFPVPRFSEGNKNN
jgi:hypothetical protein